MTTKPDAALCRDAFEAWAQDMEYGSYSVNRRDDGGYSSSHTHLMWLAWQKSWNTRTPATAPAGEWETPDGRPIFGEGSPHDVEEHLDGIATASVSEPELVEAVARGIAISIYRTDGLETMNYAGEDDYANREWQHYEVQAKAALAIAREAIEGPLLGEIAEKQQINERLGEIIDKQITYKSCMDKSDENVRLLREELTTLQAENKALREKVKGMKADEAELRRVAWKNPDGLLDFVRMNYPLSHTGGGE